jgi:predicted naringenin-chalcone synthase
VSAARLASYLAAHEPDQARRIAALYRRSGVRTRRFALLQGSPGAGEPPWRSQDLFQAATPGASAGERGPGTASRMARYERHAAPLAVEAAQATLVGTGVSSARVTHLVTVSCTGFVAPGVDIALIEQLGLARGVERVHVGFMGCQGALNGLRVARALAVAEPGACVLLCAVELCGLHFQYADDPDAAVANSLFADGAAAALVAQGDDEGGWRLAASASALLPDSLDAMTWAIGDRGFRMTLSPRVPALIEQHLGSWLAGWLARQGLAIGDVASWAIHPGGTRVVGAVERALGLDARAGAAAREVLAEHGNMSSPTVLFVLKRLMDRGARRPCVALAFGPGLTVEAALLT